MKRESKPFMRGKRAFVAIYLELDIFDKLEKKRGITNRSAYVGDIVEKALNENSECEA